MHTPRYQNRVFRSSNTPASSRYKAQLLLNPVQKEDFTQGLRVKPNSLALRANKPAATGITWV